MDDDKIKRFAILLCFTFLESSTCLAVFNETNEDSGNAQGENSSLIENYTCMALHKCDHYGKLFDDIMSEAQRENVLQFYNRISCETEDLPEDDLETSIYKGKICCFPFFLNMYVANINCRAMTYIFCDVNYIFYSQMSNAQCQQE